MTRGSFAKDHRTAWIAVAAALMLAAFGWDYLSGNEISLGLMYVIAVAVAAWFGGRGAGIVLAGFGTIAWVSSYLLVGRSYSQPGILAWNVLVELGIYLMTAIAVAQARTGLDVQRELAARLAEANRALDREAISVGTLQRELLPLEPPAIPGYAWDHHYATSTRAGGDYYDFFALPDGRVGFLVADASGHGTPAAVLMAMLRVLLRTTAEPLEPPERVLCRLNRQLAGTLPAGWFVTACYAVLEPASGRLAYALAGHDPPLILRAAGGLPERLDPRGGTPLGPFPEARYEGGRTTLGPGDALVIYTDGLTEAMSPEHELFGAERVVAGLAEARGWPLEELRAHLLSRVEAHTGSASLDDDLTLLLLRREGIPVHERQAVPATLAHANVIPLQHHAGTMAGRGEG